MYEKTRAAVSGYANVGIPASLSLATPLDTNFPPIQLARMGLPCPLAYGFKLSATSEGLVIPWGQRTASRPWLFGSCTAISRARAYSEEPASPKTSIGFAWLQCGERNSFRDWIVVSQRGESSPPVAISVSVARTPGPPALVSTVSRGPLGRG